MSLTGFIAKPEVRAKIKPLRPKLSRKIDAPLKVEPRTKHYGVVGTALDYLLRFELQRQAPQAIAREWVAESAPDIIWRESDGATVYMDPRHTRRNGVPPDDDYEDVHESAQRVRNIVGEAKRDVATSLKSKRPSSTQKEEIAGYALRLAQLDSVYRAHQLDPQFETVDPADIQDLLALVAIVPFDALLHEQVMLLNPTFGEASSLVGGADLIAGDMIVDFKTTKKNAMNVRGLDQSSRLFFDRPKSAA